ncbi:MAG: hypothetical protein HQK54_17840 [Oligoflexales bacterium]|nr:hypothetical protein [Oligoflexales bacterium]
MAPVSQTPPASGGYQEGGRVYYILPGGSPIYNQPGGSVVGNLIQGDHPVVLSN